MLKTKKNTPKQNRIQYWILRHKYLSILIILFSIISVFLGVDVYIKNTITQDRNDVLEMRDEIRNLTAELAVIDDKLQWEDVSRCVVYTSRSFGDKVRYTCNASYEAIYPVNDKESIEGIVKSHDSILEKNDSLSLSNDTLLPYIRESDTHTGMYRQIRSFSFTLLSTNTDKCNINYDLNALVVGYSLSINIKCYQDTQKAYFEPIQYI